MRVFLEALAKDELDGVPYWPLKAVLWVLALVYGLCAGARNGLYDAGILRPRRLPKPVISVGNITAGGSGKTPAVQFLAQFLSGRGLRPAVLTRGYMRGASGDDSDEARMLAMALPGVPVITGADRYKSAVKFLTNNTADVFIMDDGFQHRQLARDVDIVVISALKPWGTGHLLPRGVLREPLKNLRRAGAVLITRADQGADHLAGIREVLKGLGVDAPVAQCEHAPVQLLDLDFAPAGQFSGLAGKKVLAVAGIAQPESFLVTLRSLNAEVLDRMFFPDHCCYSRDDAGLIAQKAGALHAQAVITTAKDAVKLKAYRDVFAGSCPVFVVSVELKFTDGGGAFLDRVITDIRR